MIYCLIQNNRNMSSKPSKSMWPSGITLIAVSFAFAMILILNPVPLMAQNTDVAPGLAAPGTTPTVYDNPGLVMQYQATITPEDRVSYLVVFASVDVEAIGFAHTQVPLETP